MPTLSGESTQLMDNAKVLKEVRDLAKNIAGSLPDNIQAASLTVKSKLPFKALSLRELLIHRMAALCIPTVQLFETKHIIPAVILTRAIVETVAVLFVLHERLNRFLKEKDKDVESLDEFFMKSLVGSKVDQEMPTPSNILNMIDRVEKTFPGYRSVYDILCEYVHPNWAGLFGSFGDIIKEKVELKLGPNERTKAYSSGLNVLSTSLMVFSNYYNETADLVQQLEDYFESTI
jgi:hypothetical protein